MSGFTNIFMEIQNKNNIGTGVVFKHRDLGPPRAPSHKSMLIFKTTLNQCFFFFKKLIV